MKAQACFTLAECLIVVTIAGILAALAIPAYGNYVIRGKIPEATSNLARMKVLMEQWFQDNRFYTTTAVTTVCGVTFNNGTNFNYACAATPTTFTITATGTGSMAGFSYTINESNVKASTIAAPAPTAWIGTQAACWITKSGGVC